MKSNSLVALAVVMAATVSCRATNGDSTVQDAVPTDTSAAAAPADASEAAFPMPSPQPDQLLFAGQADPSVHARLEGFYVATSSLIGCWTLDLGLHRIPKVKDPSPQFPSVAVAGGYSVQAPLSLGGICKYALHPTEGLMSLVISTDDGFSTFLNLSAATGGANTVRLDDVTAVACTKSTSPAGDKRLTCTLEGVDAPGMKTIVFDRQLVESEGIAKRLDVKIAE
jgi:hypothetical protein